MPNGNLDHIFRSVVARFADKVAVESADDVLSYEELDRRIDDVAAGLQAQGIVPGDYLGMAIADGLHFVTVLFAVWRVGATPAPLDAGAKTAELDLFASRFELRAVISDRPAVASSVCPTLMVERLWSTATRPEAVADKPPASGPSLIALTSGTTGRPRGAAVTFDQLYARFTVHLVNRPTGPDDRFLATLPMRFGAMRAHVLGRLLTGGTVIFNQTLLFPAQIAEAIHRLRVTSVFLVPAVVRSLLALAEGDRPLFPALERLDCGGDFLRPDEKRAAARRLSPGFHETYASAAGGLVSILTPVEIEAHAESVGRPLMHVLVQIVGESDQPLPPGEIGRLRFLSPGNATHYIGDDEPKEATSDAITAGWAYPGDLAMFDEGGFLHLRGRPADLIIRGGANIYPAEIEEVLARHPDVREVCAVGWPSKTLGQEIALFVVADGQADLTTIRTYCRSNLAPQKQPREVFFVASLPRNAAGKIVRRELADTLSAID